MIKKIPLSIHQKSLIRRLRNYTYVTNNLHGIIGYDSICANMKIINSLISKSILEFEGYTMNDKAKLFSLTQLGKTIKI